MTEGEILRDAGIEIVLNHNKEWKRQAHAFLGECFMPGDEVTGEDIRLGLTKFGVIPNHHNAWGGFIMSLVKSGTLNPTGEHRSMQDSRSHARKTPTYKVTHHEQADGSPAGVGAPVPQDAHRAPCVEHILPGHHTQDGAERAPQATEAARSHPAAQT